MDSLIIVAAFFVSLGLTYWVRRFALAKDIIDTPNERSSHTIPTPRGGGLAIVISIYMVITSYYFLGYLDNAIFWGLLGLAAIALIGFIDDHNHIPARYRLIVHFAAAIWACFWLGIIPWELHNQFLTLLLWGVSLLYLVWLLNLYNFMDGIDGIATIEAITVIASAIILLILSNNFTQDKLLLLGFLAAFAGFLVWNWPPAKIFMGDVGSAFLGILIGSLSLMTANEGSLSITIWLILLAVFITDATYTLLIRLLRGDKVYQAHRSHAYQILSRQYGHKKVTIGVLLINSLWLLPIAGIAQLYPQFLLICFIMAYLPLIFLANKCRAGHPE